MSSSAVSKTRRPRGAISREVLRHIENAEKESREWSLSTIAEDLKIDRQYAHIVVTRLRAEGQLVSGAQKIVRVGLVIARPEASQPAGV